MINSLVSSFCIIIEFENVECMKFGWYYFTELNGCTIHTWYILACVYHVILECIFPKSLAMYTVTTTRWTLLICWLCQAGWSEGQYILHELRCSFDLVNYLDYAIAYTFFAFTPVFRFKPMVHKPRWHVGWMEKHRLAIITKWYFWWFLGALILSRAVPFISFWYGMHHMSWVLVSVTPVATLFSDVFITHVYN